MRDVEIRLAVRARLAALHALEIADTCFRDELGLCLGETRVDVAVINGAMSGYEIKSARDTLGRFPAQVNTYGKVLDHAVVVTEAKFIERVHDHIPEWWGVWAALFDGQDVVLTEVRAAGTNDSPDPFCIAQLLWRDEALAALVERGLGGGLRSATRWILWDRLAELPVDELRHEVRTRLKGRVNWPGG